MDSNKKIERMYMSCMHVINTNTHWTVLHSFHPPQDREEESEINEESMCSMDNHGISVLFNYTVEFLLCMPLESPPTTFNAQSAD